MCNVLCESYVGILKNEGKVIYAMDALFGLPRKRSAVATEIPYMEILYFVINIL